MELKERILEEASNLFFRKGIRSITMSDIANHLGISKRTLYEVFKDKEELLEECISIHMCRADEEIEQIITSSGNVINTMMRIYAKHLNEAHNIKKAAIYDLKKYHPRIYQKIENKQGDGVSAFLPLFQQGVEQGLIREDVNLELCLWLIKGQFKMLMESDYIPVDKFGVNEYVRAIILNFTRGISTPEGNKLIDETVAKINKAENKI